MKELLITYGLLDSRKAELEKLGYKIHVENEKTIEYKEYMKEVEVLVCYNPFERIDIDKFENLKWIQLSSMGFDQVPLDKLKNRSIIITNNKGGYSIPMGEWIVLNVLELIKRRPQCYKNKELKNWKMDFKVKEIYGKTISFIGTGEVAREGARRLKGFNLEILGINTNGRDVEYFDKCYNMNSINQVVNKSDVVIITLPYTKETHYLFDKELISNIKKGAYLVNISRGGIIDENALIEAIKQRHLLGAALDVFEQEPLSKESELWTLDNVTITCHNSWISENIDHRRWGLYVENLTRYLMKEPLLNLVDINRGY